MKNEAIIFIGHGSQETSSNEEFCLLVEKFREFSERINVYHCFVELEAPLMTDLLFAVAKRSEIESIIIIPIFLFSSRHVKNDIPIIVEKVRSLYPHKNIRCADSLKSKPEMIDLVLKRINESITGDFKDRVLLMVGRGASDPDSNSEFQKITRLVEEKGQFNFSLSSYVGITTPLLSESLNLISRIRPVGVVVVPYFLFHGRLVDKINRDINEFQLKFPWINIEVTKHLGVDELIFSSINDFIENKETINSSCINCQYRPELKNIAINIKSLDALLWSVRHLDVHAKSPPHDFPHKKLKRHVLVCESGDCSKKNSPQITSDLRRLIKAESLQEKIRVTKTSCMGRCGEGPVLVVYPDGVWYRNVTPLDTEDLFNMHIKNDQIVSRLVDDIMV